MTRLSFLLFSSLYFLSLATGCATIFDPRPVVRVSSTPEGAGVYYRGEKVGVTPTFVEIGYQHHPQIELKTKNESQTLILKTKYRWGRSFAGNLIFLEFAPAGWLTDIATGHAWWPEYEIDTKLEEMPAVPKKVEGPVTLAIAPPQAMHANLTDEVAHEVENRLRKMYPQYKILSYGENLREFRKEGVDFDGGSDSEAVRNRLFYNLHATKIYFSEVNTTDDKVVVRGEIVDGLEPEHSEKKDFDLSSVQFQSMADLAWFSDVHSIFYWLPNTVAIDFGSTTTEFGINGQTSTATPQAFGGLWGGVESVISDISIRRVAPPVHRDIWSFRFSFVPTASFSYTNEEFSKIPELASQTFHRLHIEAGWGPSLAWGSRRWNIYINLLPVWAYDQIATSVGADAYITSNSRATLGTEFGAMYFFAPHWVSRLYYRSTPVPTATWSGILRDALQSDVTIDSVNEVAIGISIGYMFPAFDFTRKK